MSIRRITDSDSTPLSIGSSDDWVIYQRTDQAPVDLNLGATPTAEKEILVSNKTAYPFDLNLPFMSQSFWTAAGGVTQTVTIPAFASFKFKFDPQAAWFLVGNG